MTKPLVGSNVRICSTPDCGRRHYAKGLCFRCYSRQRYRNNSQVSRRGRRGNKLTDGGLLFIEWRDNTHITNGTARGQWGAFQRDCGVENTPGKCTVAEFEQFIAWVINKGSSRQYACLVCGKIFTSYHHGAKLCSDACRRLRRIQHVRRYQNANSEKKRDYERRWKAANPDKVREYGRRYREANPDKKRELNRQYYLTNRDQIRERKRKRRTPVRSTLRKPAGEAT